MQVVHGCLWSWDASQGATQSAERTQDQAAAIHSTATS